MSDLAYQPNCVCSKAEIDIYKMRDRTLQVTITTDVGDLTGSKLWFSVKQNLEDLDVNALITKLSLNNGGGDDQAMVTDGVNRVVEFYLERTDTQAMDPGDYWMDAVIQLPSARRLQLIPPTRFTLHQPATVTT
jgi:hypothetical protein